MLKAPTASASGASQRRDLLRRSTAASTVASSPSRIACTSARVRAGKVAWSGDRADLISDSGSPAKARVPASPQAPRSTNWRRDRRVSSAMPVDQPRVSTRPSPPIGPNGGTTVASAARSALASLGNRGGGGHRRIRARARLAALHGGVGAGVRGGRAHRLPGAGHVPRRPSQPSADRIERRDPGRSSPRRADRRLARGRRELVA
jgi:hypothetical protein